MNDKTEISYFIKLAHGSRHRCDLLGSNLDRASLLRFAEGDALKHRLAVAVVAIRAYDQLDALAGYEGGEGITLFHLTPHVSFTLEEEVQQ